MNELMDTLWDSMGHTKDSWWDSSPFFFFFLNVWFLCLFFFLILFCFLGRLLGQRENTRGQGGMWDQNAWCQIHKESTKQNNF